MSVEVLDEIDGDLNAIVALDDSDIEDEVLGRLSGLSEVHLIAPQPPRQVGHTWARADRDYFERNWRARPNPARAPVVAEEPESVPPVGLACSAMLP